MAVQWLETMLDSSRILTGEDQEHVIELLGPIFKEAMDIYKCTRWDYDKIGKTTLRSLIKALKGIKYEERMDVYTIMSKLSDKVRDKQLFHELKL
jgi:hypothetical protein